MEDTNGTRSTTVLHGTARDRDGAIREAGEKLIEIGSVMPAYVATMFDREKSVSTYMGNFLAIPHGTECGKSGILYPGLSLIRYDEEIDWGMSKPVRFVVGIAGKEGEHMEMLSKIALAFSDMESVEKMLAANSGEEIERIMGWSQ